MHFLLQESVEGWLGQIGTSCCREEPVKAIPKNPKKPTKNLYRNPLAIVAFLENSQKRRAVMILSLSALLGSNYFQLRLFSVSDMTYLSNNPRWMFLLGTYPASPCTPVNFLHPIFLQASAAVDLLWTWLMTFLSFLGWTRLFNKFSPPFQCTQGFVNLFKIPLACLFSWLKHPNPLGWFL